MGTTSSVPARIQRPTFNDDQTREDFWREHVETWRRSGLSQSEFAQTQGLVLSQFSYWKRKFDSVTHTTSRKSFVPVTMTGHSPTVRLLHPNGLVIECLPGTDTGWLRSLIGISDAP
jgi:hypothetical protein